MPQIFLRFSQFTEFNESSTKFRENPNVLFSLCFSLLCQFIVDFLLWESLVCYIYMVTDSFWNWNGYCWNLLNGHEPLQSVKPVASMSRNVLSWKLIHYQTSPCMYCSYTCNTWRIVWWLCLITPWGPGACDYCLFAWFTYFILDR